MSDWCDEYETRVSRTVELGEKSGLGNQNYKTPHIFLKPFPAPGTNKKSWNDDTGRGVSGLRKLLGVLQVPRSEKD